MLSLVVFGGGGSRQNKSCAVIMAEVWSILYRGVVRVGGSRVVCGVMQGDYDDDDESASQPI